MKKQVTITSLALAFGFTGLSRADLLVYDPFDYSNNNTTIHNQSSTARTGFANSDAWVAGASAFTHVGFNSTAGSLGYGDLVTSGGSGTAFRDTGSGVPITAREPGELIEESSK